MPSADVSPASSLIRDPSERRRWIKSVRSAADDRSQWGALESMTVRRRESGDARAAWR
jgi:hypothetical protein